MSDRHYITCGRCHNFRPHFATTERNHRICKECVKSMYSNAHIVKTETLLSILKEPDTLRRLKYREYCAERLGTSIPEVQEELSKLVSDGLIVIPAREARIQSLHKFIVKEFAKSDLLKKDFIKQMSDRFDYSPEYIYVLLRDKKNKKGVDKAPEYAAIKIVEVLFCQRELYFKELCKLLPEFKDSTLRYASRQLAIAGQINKSKKHGRTVLSLCSIPATTEAK